MGAFWRTWIRLSQRFKKSATPATELPDLLSEPIKGIRATRKLAIDAPLRDEQWLAARSHLQDMDQHISELEAVHGLWGVEEP